MGNEIAKRYRLCTNCSDRILSGSCDGKCKEYWKYVGATEQKNIDEAKLLKLKSAWEKQAQINHNDEANYQQGYHDAIEKACKWMKEQVYQEYGGGPLERLIPDTSIEEFRKAMEE